MKGFRSALMIMGLVSTFATGSAKADDGQLELLTPGTVKCAFTGSFPPYAFQKADGQWDGLTIRIFREAVTRAGLKLEYVITKWDSLLIGLSAGNYDIVCDTMDITKERQKQVLFVDGWLESGGRVLAHKDAGIATLADVKGKSMGVLVGSTWAELAKPLEPGTTKYYQGEAEAYQDLANKGLDVMVTDSVAGAWAIKESHFPVTMLPDYLVRVQKGWAASKDHPNLVKAINTQLEAMRRDGTYTKLTTELIGIDPGPQTPIRTVFE